MADAPQRCHSNRYITLPAVHRRVPLGAYVAGVKLAIANPAREFDHGLTCWTRCTGAEIRAQFRRGLHDRINSLRPYVEVNGYVPPKPRGRKDDQDWLRHCRLDQHAIHDRVRSRVVLHYIRTPELRRRFGHLIAIDHQEDA